MRRALPWLLVLAAGCGQDGELGDTPSLPPLGQAGAPSDAVVELGVGLHAFAPLAEGDALLVCNGAGQPQGFSHIVYNARCQRVDHGVEGEHATYPRTRISLWTPDGELLVAGDERGRQLDYPRPDGAWMALEGGKLLPMSTDLGLSLLDRDAVVVVELIDNAGHYARDQRAVHVVEDPRSAIAGCPE
jgi:hypothetical protein